MPVAARSIPAPTAESEAFHALLLLAERRTGRIPPDRLVRHVLSVTAQAGWPGQRAALEAGLPRAPPGEPGRGRGAPGPPPRPGAVTNPPQGPPAPPRQNFLR